MPKPKPKPKPKATTKKLAPIHPGQILKDFMHENELSANRLALAIQVPAGRITQILNGQRALTADTAIRLAHFFGTSAELWMNLQSHYELQCARQALPDVEKAGVRTVAAVCEPSAKYKTTSRTRKAPKAKTKK
jgi:addiction module HigA family antidote